MATNEQRIEALKLHCESKGYDFDIDDLDINDLSFETSYGDFIVLTDDERMERLKEYYQETLWAFNAHFLLEKMGLLTDHPSTDQQLVSSFKKFQSELCEDANPLVKALVSARVGGIEKIMEDMEEIDHDNALDAYDGEPTCHDIDDITLWVARWN